MSPTGSVTGSWRLVLLISSQITSYAIKFQNTHWIPSKYIWSTKWQRKYQKFQVYWHHFKFSIAIFRRHKIWFIVRLILICKIASHFEIKMLLKPILFSILKVFSLSLLINFSGNPLRVALISDIKPI